MKKKIIYVIVGATSLVAGFLLWFNYNYQVIALHPFQETEAPDLRVMSFNIHSHGDSYDGKKIYSFIMEQKPDILLLNEYNDSICHLLDSLLLGSYKYSEGERKGACQDIIYSRFPVEGFVGVKGDGIHALIHKCEVDVNRRIRFFFCHLASNNKEGVNIERTVSENSKSSWTRYWDGYHMVQKTREKEIGLICNQIDTVPPLPTIIMGDMNDFSYSRIFNPFYSRGFKDTWWSKGNGYGATYKYKCLSLRIDHVFFNGGLEPTKAMVIGTELSDHNPIVAEFKLSR